MLDTIHSKITFSKTSNMAFKCKTNRHKKLTGLFVLLLSLFGSVTFTQAAQAETYTFYNVWNYSYPTNYASYTDTDGTFTLSWNFVWPGSPNNWVSFKLRKDGATTTLSTSTYSKSYSNLSPGVYEFVISATYTVWDGFEYLPETKYSQKKIRVTVSAPPVPGTPSMNMTTTDNNGSYNISWGSVANATSYKWQERVNGGSWSGETTTSSTSASRTGKTSATYGYRVRACNATGCSGYSSERSVIVAITPGVPGSISVPTTTGSDFSVSWSAGSGTVSAYELERQRNGGAWTSAYNGAGLSQTESVSSLNGGTYLYRIRARNTVDGYSSYSAWLQSTQMVLYARTGAATEIRYTYDALGRLQFVEDSLNGNRDYDYDDAGNRTAVAEGVADEDDDPYENASGTQLAAPSGLNLIGPLGQGGGYTAEWYSVANADHYVVGMEDASQVETTNTWIGTAMLRPVWVQAVNYNSASAKSYF